MQFQASDDGRKNRPKHVEHLTGINKLRKVASGWLYSANTIESLRNGMFYVYSCVLQYITDYVLCAVNCCVSLLCTMIAVSYDPPTKSPEQNYSYRQQIPNVTKHTNRLHELWLTHLE